MWAEYKFLFSEEHVLTACLRYRQQIWWRRPFLTMKWLLVAIFCIPLIIAIHQGIQVLTMLCCAVLGSLLLGWRIDAWIIRKRFRKSPYHNDNVEFTLSENGAHSVGQSSEVRIAWRNFTKVRRFRDGLLVFQGPHLFHWLPDAAAVDSTALDVAEKLLRAHVRDYRDA